MDITKAERRRCHIARLKAAAARPAMPPTTTRSIDEVLDPARGAAMVAGTTAFRRWSAWKRQACGAVLVLAVLAATFATAEAATRCRSSKNGSTTHTECVDRGEKWGEKAGCRSYKVGSTTYTSCR